MYTFTAVNSESFKDKLMELYRDGSTTRWVFATIVAGMGTDISDILTSVIVGVKPLDLPEGWSGWAFSGNASFNDLVGRALGI